MIWNLLTETSYSKDIRKHITNISSGEKSKDVQERRMEGSHWMPSWATQRIHALGRDCMMQVGILPFLSVMELVPIGERNSGQPDTLKDGEKCCKPELSREN